MRPLLIPLFLLAGVALAGAHAFLDHAEPRVGSSVQGLPRQIKLWMTEQLEPAFCKVRVFDSAGREVDDRDTKATGSIMTVSIPVLAAGTYKVAWIAVATDTHKTTGTFTFTVE